LLWGMTAGCAVSINGKELCVGLNSKEVIPEHRNSGGTIPDRMLQLACTNGTSDS